MKKKIIKALEKSIEHWSRMIAWAKTKDPIDEHFDFEFMEKEIKESPGSKYCSLCQLFKASCYKCINAVTVVVCPLLSISIDDWDDERNCCDEYSAICDTIDYEEFITAANKMLARLKRELKRVKSIKG